MRELHKKAALGGRLFVQLCTFVFFAGGHAAADMALGLVHLQHGLDLKIQRAVEFRQPLAQILVDSAFADAELFGGGADSGPVFYDVLSKRDGTLLDVPFQSNNTPCL